MLPQKSPGFTVKKNRRQRKTGNSHAERDKGNGAKFGGRHSHERKGRSPDRGESEEEQDVGDAHGDEVVAVSRKVKTML